MEQKTPAAGLTIAREDRGFPPSQLPPAPQKPIASPQMNASPKRKRKFTLRRLGALIGAMLAVVAVSYYGWRYWTVGRF